MKNQLNVPILYLIFNRLDSVKKTFPEIAKQKPLKIFIACDGPRNPEEKKKTDAVRTYVLDNINWNCDVKTLFRDNNLGCRKSVSGAIDWFFENVEEGIILEDDCFPDESFFGFCGKMLEKYRNNKNIMSVSGYNYLEDLDVDESYYFSRYFECWGWATWKRAWKKCDINMNDYKSDKKLGRLKEVMPSFLERVIYKKRFEGNLKGETNSWAYCFTYSHFRFNGLSITPKYSLIKNLGISKDSTHTSENETDKKYFDTKVFPIEFPLKYPKKVKLNNIFCRKYLKKEVKRIILKTILWN